MPSSIRRIDVAGRDVTEYMQLLLRKSGYVFHTSAEKEVVRMIKEKVSYVAADPKREEKEWAQAKVGDGKVVEYALPDGNKIKVRLPLCQFVCVCLPNFRLEQSDSELLKFSSTQKSLASSIQVSIKLWWTQSTEQILTCGNPFSATSYCQGEAH